MKIPNKKRRKQVWVCDKCGEEGDDMRTLTAIFQHPYQNIGPIHLCSDDCYNDFMVGFGKLTPIKTMLQKQGRKTLTT